MRDCLRTCHCNETIHPLAAGRREGVREEEAAAAGPTDRQTNKTEEQPLLYGFLINFQVQRFFVLFFFPSRPLDKGPSSPSDDCTDITAAYLHNNMKR